MKRVMSGRSSSVYRNKSSVSVPEYDKYQQRVINKGLEEGLDVSVYADPKFDSYQMNVIREGLENGVDVSIYADPKFNAQQMFQICSGLEEGLDVSVYADPEYDNNQMATIRRGLREGLDVSKYADPNLPWVFMSDIREGLAYGFDMTQYLNQGYDNQQFEQILEGLESGLDVSSYADPKNPVEVMHLIRKCLELGLDYSKYLNDLHTLREIDDVRWWISEHPDDPMLKDASAELLFKAAKSNARSLEYASLDEGEKAKYRWNEVKQAVQNESVDVSEFEEQFDLISLEGRAAFTLGLEFDENDDGSVTFRDREGEEVDTLSKQEYDMLVRSAIVNSSTRQSFAKAFATQLKKALDL